MYSTRWMTSFCLLLLIMSAPFSPYSWTVPHWRRNFRIPNICLVIRMYSDTGMRLVESVISFSLSELYNIKCQIVANYFLSCNMNSESQHNNCCSYTISFAFRGKFPSVSSIIFSLSGNFFNLSYINKN